MPVLTVHVGRCADTFVGARLVLTVAAVIMDGSKTKTKTNTKINTKTAVTTKRDKKKGTVTFSVNDEQAAI